MLAADVNTVSARRSEIEALFFRFNPGKLHTVDHLLEKYGETRLLQLVRKKYGRQSSDKLLSRLKTDLVASEMQRPPKSLLSTQTQRSEQIRATFVNVEIAMTTAARMRAAVHTVVATRTLTSAGVDGRSDDHPEDDANHGGVLNELAVDPSSLPRGSIGTVRIEFEDLMLVTTLKEKIEELKGIPREQQHLRTAGGRTMEDSHNLSDYGIVHESTIHLKRRQLTAAERQHAKRLVKAEDLFAKREAARLTQHAEYLLR
jgi:hypothetical protein